MSKLLYFSDSEWANSHRRIKTSWPEPVLADQVFSRIVSIARPESISFVGAMRDITFKGGTNQPLSPSSAEKPGFMTFHTFSNALTSSHSRSCQSTNILADLLSWISWSHDHPEAIPHSFIRYNRLPPLKCWPIWNPQTQCSSGTFPSDTRTQPPHPRTGFTSSNPPVHETTAPHLG